MEDQRRNLFERYIQRRLEEPQTEVFSQGARHWLSWLARQMQAHNQTIFYLEHLQSDWLPKAREQDRYERVTTRGAGIIIGVVMSLLVTTLVLGGASFPYPMWYVCIGGLLGGVISGKGPARFHLSEIRSRFVLHWRKVGLLSVCVGVFLGGLGAIGFALGEGPPDYPYDWVIYASSLSLCSGILTMLVVLGKQTTQQTVPSAPRWHRWYHVLPYEFSGGVLRFGTLSGLLLGLSYGLSVGLSLGLGGNGLSTGLANGLSYGLRGGLSFGAIGVFLSLLLLGKTETIELAERLVWSRKQIRESLLSKRHLSESACLFLLLFLFFGLANGLAVGLLSWLSNGPSLGLSTGLSTGLSVGSAYWLLIGLWKGLSQETLDDHVRMRPNQGVLRSIRSAFLVGGLSGIISFLIGLTNPTIYDFFSTMLANVLSNGPRVALSNALIDDLSTGLSTGFLLGCAGFLLTALLTGGLASLRHLLLRLQLRHLGLVPRHYVRFLDDAARRILLYKDGGGYRFIHRLFLDYFADLEIEPDGQSSAAPRREVAHVQTDGVSAAPQSS